MLTKFTGAECILLLFLIKSVEIPPLWLQTFIHLGKIIKNIILNSPFWLESLVLMLTLKNHQRITVNLI